MLTGNKKYANEILDDIECYKAVLDGRIRRFPNGFWTKPWSLQSASTITRYLIEERFKYTEEDIKTKVDSKLFRDNKLHSLLKIFNDSVYNVINNAYPNRFKPWQLNNVPRGFWDNKGNIIDAVRWLVETKLDNNKERVKKEFNGDLIIKYGLGALRKYGVYNLLNEVYTNEFKPWEISQVPSLFWKDKKNIQYAVRWIVETKLDNNRERVCKEFTKELLTRYELGGLVRYGVYNVINITYPNEFKPWELTSVSPRFWDDKSNIIEAVRWIVETKLDNNKERVKKEFNTEILYSANIASLNKYGIYNLLNMAYPNEFKPSDFKYGNRYTTT